MQKMLSFTCIICNIDKTQSMSLQRSMLRWAQNPTTGATDEDSEACVMLVQGCYMSTTILVGDAESVASGVRIWVMVSLKQHGDVKEASGVMVTECQTNPNVMT